MFGVLADDGCLKHVVHADHVVALVEIVLERAGSLADLACLGSSSHSEALFLVFLKQDFHFSSLAGIVQGLNVVGGGNGERALGIYQCGDALQPSGQSEGVGDVDHVG